MAVLRKSRLCRNLEENRATKPHGAGRNGTDLFQREADLSGNRPAGFGYMLLSGSVIIAKETFSGKDPSGSTGRSGCFVWGGLCLYGKIFL